MNIYSTIVSWSVLYIYIVYLFYNIVQVTSLLIFSLDVLAIMESDVCMSPNIVEFSIYPFNYANILFIYNGAMLFDL